MLILLTQVELRIFLVLAGRIGAIRLQRSLVCYLKSSIHIYYMYSRVAYIYVRSRAKYLKFRTTISKFNTLRKPLMQQKYYFIHEM